MIRALLRTAEALDRRGQYDLADRFDSMVRSAARYEWPQQYTLDLDEPEQQPDPSAPTPY